MFSDCMNDPIESKFLFSVVLGFLQSVVTKLHVLVSPLSCTARFRILPRRWPRRCLSRSRSRPWHPASRRRRTGERASRETRRGIWSLRTTCPTSECTNLSDFAVRLCVHNAAQLKEVRDSWVKGNLLTVIWESKPALLFDRTNNNSARSRRDQEKAWLVGWLVGYAEVATIQLVQL